MSLVAAKCTECGSSIEVDDSKEAGICRHCGTAFITQKAITNYNTYINNNIVLDKEAQEQILKNIPSLATAQERCEKLLKIGEFSKSFSVASEMIEIYPESPIGYIWAIKSFEEYYTYNTPKYTDALKKRSQEEYFNIKLGYSVSKQHPINEYYQNLLKRLSKEELENYSELLEIVKAIMHDFHNSMKDTLKQRNKRHYIGFGISSLLLLILISLIVMSAVLNIEALLIISSIICFVAFLVTLWYFITFLMLKSYTKKFFYYHLNDKEN